MGPLPPFPPLSHEQIALAAWQLAKGDPNAKPPKHMAAFAACLARAEGDAARAHLVRAFTHRWGGETG